MSEKKQKKHYTHGEIARLLVEGRWGRDAASPEEAVQALVGTAGAGAAGAALLALLERFDVAVKALARLAAPGESPYAPLWPEGPPGYAARFPGVAVGDSLYAIDDLEDGLRRYLVVALGPGDTCLVVEARADARGYSPRDTPFYARDALRRTPAEALRAQAEADVKYYEPRAELARRVMAAVEANEDLSGFYAGVDVDEGVGEGEKGGAP